MKTHRREATARLTSAGGKVVSAVGPTMGFEIGGAVDLEIVSGSRRPSPQIVLVGFGAPKQERWMAPIR